LGCSCPLFARKTAQIVHMLEKQRSLDLDVAAFREMAYAGSAPCAHMRLVLHALRGLSCLQSIGDLLALDAVPVLPWPRELIWTGPPREPFRLPFGRSADVSTRVYSVADADVRAIVKVLPHSHGMSCARLEGLLSCKSGVKCCHKLEAAGALDDVEDQAVLQECEPEDPKEVRVLSLLQSRDPFMRPPVRVLQLGSHAACVF
jgi:hypothetical protein